MEADANRPRCASKTRLLHRKNGFYTDYTEASQRAVLDGLRNVTSPPLSRPAFEDSLATTRAPPVMQVASPIVHERGGVRVVAKSAAPGAYQRDDDHDQHAVRPCHRRAVGVARVKSSRRLPVGPATAPRTSNVEADHVEVVAHVLRFAYFLLAPAGARNLQKLASSWRASPAVPDRNFSVSARQKIDEPRRSGQWCPRA